jgi:MoaA/NifB/PqqE/SkfB family radical SAM enzyme
MVIDINVTSTCNLACTYCSEGYECGLSTEFEENTSVTLDNIEEFMAKISDPKKDVYFWGGEPFVNTIKTSLSSSIQTACILKST